MRKQRSSRRLRRQGTGSYGSFNYSFRSSSRAAAASSASPRDAAAVLATMHRQQKRDQAATALQSRARGAFDRQRTAEHLLAVGVAAAKKAVGKPKGKRAAPAKKPAAVKPKRAAKAPVKPRKAPIRKPRAPKS